MRLRFFKYVFLLIIFAVSPLDAQIRIDGLRILLSNIPISDSVIRIDHYQTGASTRDYDHVSNDSGYTVISNDTVLRIDKIAQSYIAPDGKKIPELYKQEIFFILDTTVNRLRQFSLNYGFYDVVQGWYSNEIISFDSIDIKRFGKDYHAYIPGKELSQHGFYLHAERGNLSPNIPGWITRMRSCDSNNCGSIDIFLNGSIALSVSDKKTDGYFVIRPNPAHDLITISSLFSDAKIEIYDLLGRLVFTASGMKYNKSVVLNVSTLIPGIYMLHSGTQIQKLYILR